MKLGVMSAGVAALGWERALTFCQSLGLDAIELACGAYTKTPLINAAELLDSAAARQRLLDDLAKHPLETSALPSHGNGVHPDPDVARRAEQIHDTVVHLAARLGVGVVNTFSGCPGGKPGDRTPNWVTCVWPTEFAAI